tara:strand:+ start:7327 stop:8406 length:1080 start_codon:yes stop_codon:yes gene_type:complete
MSCCCPDCPCPGAHQTGAGWRKGNCSTGAGGKEISEPCCMCDPDIKPSTPHLETFAPWDETLQSTLDVCDAVCDPVQAGQEGEYEYTYGTTDGKEDKSKVLSRTWVGECPENKPDSPECECECSLKVNDTCPGDEIPNPDPDVCDCICGLTDDDCPADLPTVDTEACECVCGKSSSDCVGDETFNSDTCECECPYDTGDATCPDDQPHQTSECGCECKQPYDCGTAGNGLYFNPAVCACVPCSQARPPCPGCQEFDEFCNCVGCESCSQTPYTTTTGDTVCCDSGQILCNDACADNNCSGGKKFNWSTCECACPKDKSDCGGTCYPPCPPGQGRDANCNCNPDYASSASLLKHIDSLLP